MQGCWRDYDFGGLLLKATKTNLHSQCAVPSCAYVSEVLALRCVCHFRADMLTSLYGEYFPP